MPPYAPYAIIYAPIVKEHLRSIDRKHYTLIRTIIQERLAYEPNEANRNRKPLKRTVFESATWELRFGQTICFGCSMTSIMRNVKSLFLPSGSKCATRSLSEGRRSIYENRISCGCQGKTQCLPQSK